MTREERKAYQAGYLVRWRAQHVALGLCWECNGIAEPGRRRCWIHRAKSNDAAKRYYARKAAERAAIKEVA